MEYILIAYLMDIIEKYMPLYKVRRKYITIYKKPESLNLEVLYSKLEKINVKIFPTYCNLNVFFQLHINKKNNTNKIMYVTLNDILYYIDEYYEYVEQYDTNNNEVICTLKPNEELCLCIDPIIINNSFSDYKKPFNYYSLKKIKNKNFENTELTIDTFDNSLNLKLINYGIHLLIYYLKENKTYFNNKFKNEQIYNENNKIILKIKIIDAIEYIFKYFLNKHYPKLKIQKLSSKEYYYGHLNLNNYLLDFLIYYPNDVNINIINEIFDMSISYFECSLNKTK